MPRPPRADEAGGLNRGNLRAEIFHKDADFAAFERILHKGLQLHQIQLFSYQLMPNHYHLILRPSVDGEMSRFMGCHFQLGGRNAYDRLSCSLSHQRAGPCLPTGATRAFQFKMTSTSSLSVGTSSETRQRAGLVTKAEDSISTPASPHAVR